jgi:hypothetical protein
MEYVERMLLELSERRGHWLAALAPAQLVSVSTLRRFSRGRVCGRVSGEGLVVVVVEVNDDARCRGGWAS